LNGFDSFQSLHEVSLHKCKIKSLKVSSFLKKGKFQYCHKLEDIDLSNCQYPVTNIIIDSCLKIKKITNLRNVKHVKLLYCSNLMDISGFGEPIGLSEEKTITSSVSILWSDKIKDFSSLRNIPSVTVRNCGNFISFSPLSLPPFLSVKASSYSSEKTSSSVGSGSSLTTTEDISFSSSNSSSPISNDIVDQNDLHISSSSPSSSSCCIQYLTIDLAPLLVDTSSFTTSSSLRYLCISSCFYLEKLVDVYNIPVVMVKRCRRLTDISELGNNHKSVVIQDCPEITDVSHLTHLKNLIFIPSVSKRKKIGEFKGNTENR
jgi:hypothetical protein